MVKKKFFLIIIFGIVVINNLIAQTDSHLNGTWHYLHGSGSSQIILNNGIYEQRSLFGEWIIFEKGTYTTGNGIIIFTPTHKTADFNDWLDRRLYTISEYATALGISINSERVITHYSSITKRYSIVGEYLLINGNYEYSNNSNNVNLWQ